MCLTLKSIIIPTYTSGKCLSRILQLVVIITLFTARWAATLQTGLYPAERADKHMWRSPLPTPLKGFNPVVEPTLYVLSVWPR